MDGFDFELDGVYFAVEPLDISLERLLSSFESLKLCSLFLLDILDSSDISL